MSVSDLTGTKWEWNFNAGFSGATQQGITKNINFTSNGETFTSMIFKQWHGGDINRLDYNSTLVYWYDDESGDGEDYPEYFTFEVTGGTDVTDSTLIGWIEANATEVPSLPSSGTHTITAKAKATGYADSNASNSVSYTVSSGYSVTISVNAYGVAVYDGQNNTGTFLGDVDDSATVTCTTGYLYFNTSRGIQSITGSNGATSTNPSIISADNASIYLEISSGGGSND